MQKYNVEAANGELNTLESVLARRVEEYLEGNDVINAARGLVAVNKEIYKLEEDARELRLTGELDVEIYRALRNGYSRIAERIMTIARGFHYTREISSLNRSLRFTNEASSLTDYLREADE